MFNGEVDVYWNSEFHELSSKLVARWSKVDLYEVVREFVIEKYGCDGTEFTKFTSDGVVMYDDVGGGIGTLEVNDIMSRMRDRKIGIVVGFG